MTILLLQTVQRTTAPRKAVLWIPLGFLVENMHQSVSSKLVQSDRHLIQKHTDRTTQVSCRASSSFWLGTNTLSARIIRMEIKRRTGTVDVGPEWESGRGGWAVWFLARKSWKWLSMGRGDCIFESNFAVELIIQGSDVEEKCLNRR